MAKFLLTIVLCFGLSTAAVACSCEDEMRSIDDTTMEEFATADVVAVMEVVAVRRSAVEFGGTRTHGRWIVMKPSHVFKGNAVLDYTFYAPAPSRFSRSTCDTDVGKKDLVLVFTKWDSPVQLGECRPSGKLQWSLRRLPKLFELAASRS